MWWGCSCSSWGTSFRADRAGILSLMAKNSTHSSSKYWQRPLAIKQVLESRTWGQRLNKYSKYNWPHVWLCSLKGTSVRSNSIEDNRGASVWPFFYWRSKNMMWQGFPFLVALHFFRLQYEAIKTNQSGTCEGTDHSQRMAAQLHLPEKGSAFEGPSHGIQAASGKDNPPTANTH